MADLPSAYPLRDLFDAAVRHRAIKLTCLKCRHVAILESAALWWLFHQRGWQDRFHQVQRRCVCTVCWYRDGLRVRHPALELVDEASTENRLKLPPELEWKRELRRRR